MALGIMARLLGHRMTRTKVWRARRRKWSGKGSLINSNVLAALVRCCHTSVKYRSPRLSSWIFPISTLLHSLSGARGRRIRIPRVTGNLGKTEVNPKDFFLYQEPDERKRWKEVIVFPVPAGLWRKLGGSLEVQAMGEAPQATGFPMGMVGAIVNPLLSAVRASLTLSFSLELLQVVDNSWSVSRENISCLSQELGASDELIKLVYWFGFLLLWTFWEPFN